MAVAVMREKKLFVALLLLFLVLFAGEAFGADSQQPGQQEEPPRKELILQLVKNLMDGKSPTDSSLKELWETLNGEDPRYAFPYIPYNTDMAWYRIQQYIKDESLEDQAEIQRRIEEMAGAKDEEEEEDTTDDNKGNYGEDDKGDDDDKDDDKDKSKLWAQEPSQIAIAVMIFAEMKTLQTIEEDQANMLKKIDAKSSEYNQILSARNNLLKNIENARDVLANSKSFTHMAKDIDAAMKARHPDWKSKMTIDEAAQRINTRQSNWKATVRDYLKSMNYSTAHFADDQRVRDGLMKVLKKPDGQVQAIQALGFYFDDMGMMLARDEQVIQGLMTALIERKIDAREERNDLDNAVKEVATSLKSYKPKTKKRKMGF